MACFLDSNAKLIPTRRIPHMIKVRRFTSTWLMLTLGVSALLSACSGPTGRALDQPKATGQEIAQQFCSNCHGLDGNSVSPQFPRLAGQQKAYLVNQLTDFKGHERRDSTGREFMWGINHLTNQQVQELAEIFSMMPPMKSHSNSITINTRGENIFLNGDPSHNVIACAACHGPDGSGQGEIPRISGQHQSYLLKQILTFKYTNDRPRGALMQQVTHDLNPDDAKNVAVYIEELSHK